MDRYFICFRIENSGLFTYVNDYHFEVNPKSWMKTFRVHCYVHKKHNEFIRNLDCYQLLP